jgi:oligoendopeptidase F
VSAVTRTPRLEHRWDLTPVFASDEAAVAELDRGGNGTPAEVLAPLGIDLDDPGLWDEGLDEVERMVEGVAD